jgi:LuxR family maltose regulon positive regulatory protein
MSGAAATAEPRWSLPLVRTKLAPPRPPPGRVERRALLARSAELASCAACVVIAPAGFGKTTLLAQWCETLRAAGQVTAWLSLDQDDDDAQLFGAYLVAAFRAASDAIGERAEALLRDDPQTPVAHVFATLLNEIAACGRSAVLVLDDFDRVTSRPIRALVARLLRYASPNLVLLLGVRGEPDLPLGPLRAERRLLWIDASELRFSRDDAQAFFAQAAPVALDRASVELLTDATEGWVAGLQLAALGVRDAGDAARIAGDLAGSRLGIDAYLHDEVLRRLPDALQRFLLRASILDRLCGGVCDAVVGGVQGARQLDWLERHNVFIRALDDERRWYRMHALLSDALRRRAALDLPDELPALHRRAAAWFAQQELWPEAVRHALAAGDVRDAADWVQAIANALIDRSDARTVLGWLSKLPRDVVTGRLALRLVECWAYVFLMRVSEARNALRALEADLGAGRHRDDPAAADPATAVELDALHAAAAGFGDDSVRSMELGALAARGAQARPHVARIAETALLFGLAYDGRFDDIRRMRSVVQAAPRAAETALYGDVYRASMFGLGALVEGRLAEALRIFEAALESAERAVGHDSAAAALPAGYLAGLYHERDQLERLQQVTEGRAGLVMQTCPLGSVLRYTRAMARLAARRDDADAAHLVLNESRELALARGWQRLRAACDEESVRLHLRHGRLELAEPIVDELEAAVAAPPPLPMGSSLETWASACSARARLEMAQGRAQAAAERLAPLRGLLGTGGMRHLDACTALLLALAHERAGAREPALCALDDALRYAAEAAMLGSLVDEGEPLLRLIEAWRADPAHSRGCDAAFVERLRAAFGTATPARPAHQPQRAAVELLSARELEILQHIARGLSNKEIARALRVAPETIKWHLKNVFEKLDVGSRLEAVEIALGDAARPAAR